MKLVFLFGNCAVGKMTVGQALCDITRLKLFHNHMTIEPVIALFGDYKPRAVARLRDVIFEEFAASDQYGMVFTYMWAFDQQADWDYVEHVKQIFAPYGTEFYYVELVAPQEIRFQRDIEASNRRLINDDLKYRCESLPGEIPFENYLRIDNSLLSPQEAARRIQAHFEL